MQEHLMKCVDILKSKYEKKLIFVALYGSQNYGLEFDGSDYDFKAIVVPSLDDIVFNRKPVSTTIEIEDGLCDVKDLRTMMGCWKKQNVNFVELLFSKAIWVNPDYKELFQPLFDNREKIVHYDEGHAINCIKGMAMEKYHALFKPYPSQIGVIEKYGYAAKQLSHIWRLRDILVKYIDKEPYSECLTPNEFLREILIDIKSYTYVYSPDKAKSSALRAIDSINEFVKDFESAPVNEKIGVVMDKVTTNIIRKALKKELFEAFKKELFEA